jgi:hypothetical protein
MNDFCRRAAKADVNALSLSLLASVRRARTSQGLANNHRPPCHALIWINDLRNALEVMAVSERKELTISVR